MNDCSFRGSNFVVVPAFIGYCDRAYYPDLAFMDTVAHELGKVREWDRSIWRGFPINLLK